MKTSAPASPLPVPFEAWLREACVTLNFLSARAVRDLALRQLANWREEPRNRRHSIPGYDSPPPDLLGTGCPHGWSLSQFVRIRREARRLAVLVQARSARLKPITPR